MPRSRRLAALLAIVLGATYAYACAEPEPVSPTRPIATVSATNAPPVPSVSAVASASAADIPEPPPEPRSLPPRDGSPPGSTRGTIACGSKRCDAGKEACIANFAAGGWICVPSSDPLQDGGYRCDDGTDCPQGETCCMSFASASTWASCSKRTYDCASELCAPGGARCPAGQTCRGGHCSFESRARCGAGACPKDEPYCVWGKEPTCATAEEAQAANGKRESGEAPDVTGVYECTQGRDCGTLHCCTGALGPSVTYCANQCDLANTRTVCDKDADCRALETAFCPDRKCARCKRPPEDEQGGLPPWMKFCELAE